MATRMQQRRGTAAQWISTNSGNGPILAAGEIGFESDTNKFKIGDGTNHWVDLTYFTDAEGATSAITDLIDGAPDLLNTLNELAAAIGDDPNFITTIASDLSTHATDTSAHGVSGAIVGTTDTQTLTNKTITDPVINVSVGGLPVSVSNEGLTYLGGLTGNIQNQLDDKLESSDLSGYATETYVGTQISNLVDSAPTALNTLNELAAALGDDANYAATVTTALGAKAPLEDPTFTGTVDLSGATVVGLPAAGPTAVEIVMGVY